MDVLSDAIAAMRTGRPHSSRTRREGPWTARLEPFAGAGFHVVLQGTCRLTPRGGKTITLGAGDVVCIPRGCAHRVSTSATTILLCGGYFLDQSRPHPVLAELPEVIHVPARAGRHPALRTAIDLLGGELERPRPGSDAVLQALLDMLLLYTLRAWLDERADHHVASGWAAALTDPTIAAALGHIHGEPARPWTVAELGARAGLSRAAFARRFTTLVGQPPLAYLTWWRMTVAAQLLRDTEAPLDTVAARTGYTSEFAFARAFKRAHGIAPGRYRHRAREKR